MVKRLEPTCVTGTVVKGFGRGSKELGIPTANLPEDVVDKLPEDVTQGIYYGWAQVGSDPVEKSVMSVGWNPYYKNTKRSAEVHILKQYDADFYGEEMRVVVLGYLRPEENYDSLDALIAAIHNDIQMASDELDTPEAHAHKTHEHFNAVVVAADQ